MRRQPPHPKAGPSNGADPQSSAAATHHQTNNQPLFFPGMHGYGAGGWAPQMPGNTQPAGFVQPTPFDHTIAWPWAKNQPEQQQALAWQQQQNFWALQQQAWFSMATYQQQQPANPETAKQQLQSATLRTQARLWRPATHAQQTSTDPQSPRKSQLTIKEELIDKLKASHSSFKTIVSLLMKDDTRWTKLDILTQTYLEIKERLKKTTAKSVLKYLMVTAVQAMPADDNKYNGLLRLFEQHNSTRTDAQNVWILNLSKILIENYIPKRLYQRPSGVSATVWIDIHNYATSSQHEEAAASSTTTASAARVTQLPAHPAKRKSNSQKLTQEAQTLIYELIRGSRRKLLPPPHIAKKFKQLLGWDARSYLHNFLLLRQSFEGHNGTKAKQTLTSLMKDVVHETTFETKEKYNTLQALFSLYTQRQHKDSWQQWYEDLKALLAEHSKPSQQPLSTIWENLKTFITESQQPTATPTTAVPTSTLRCTLRAPADRDPEIEAITALAQLHRKRGRLDRQSPSL